MEITVRLSVTLRWCHTLQDSGQYSPAAGGMTACLNLHQSVKLPSTIWSDDLWRVYSTSFIIMTLFQCVCACVCVNGCGRPCKVIWGVRRLERSNRNARPFTTSRVFATATRVGFQPEVVCCNHPLLFASIFAISPIVMILDISLDMLKERLVRLLFGYIVGAKKKIYYFILKSYVVPTPWEPFPDKTFVWEG